MTLDAVVTAFRAGTTAEEIAQRFPIVSLSDVYQIIVHYLNHTSEIEAYLSQRQIEAAALKREIEAHFDAEVFALVCSRAVQLGMTAVRQCSGCSRTNIVLATWCEVESAAYCAGLILNFVRRRRPS